MVKFSEMNAGWLAKVLPLDDGPAIDPHTTRRRALTIFAAVEGAQLVARSRDDVTVYEDIVEIYRAAGLFA